MVETVMVTSSTKPCGTDRGDVVTANALPYSDPDKTARGLLVRIASDCGADSGFRGKFLLTAADETH